MADGWTASAIQDGEGYSYTAEHGGVLLASGWVRIDGGLPRARQFAVDVGRLALAAGAKP